MKINRLTVDGYGVWTGLRVDRLAEGVNVLYGPNEAGKTTLLQFIRGVLYGFTRGRTQYLPPLRGGRPGGSLELDSLQGNFVLDRYQESTPEGSPAEELVLTATDGTRQGEPLLRVVLGNIDEVTFQNVFAVGLREMQELGTLSDSKAADLLYSLTVGLDRVSLVDVTSELAASRNRLLASDGGPCQIAQLTEERMRLRAELEQLATGMRHYVRLAAEREQLTQELGRLETEQVAIEQQARAVELAATLRERWQHREQIEEQLSRLPAATAIPDGAVEQLDAIVARLAKHEQRKNELLSRRRQLKTEADSLAIHRGLWRQAARIEAMLEQASWIESLTHNISELESEVASLEGTLRRERESLGFATDSVLDAPLRLSHQAVKRLRIPAAAVRTARKQVDEARQQLAAARDEADSLNREMQVAFAGQNEHELATVIDQAGARVAQLRRRLLIDDRLDELTRYQADLEEQSREHLQRQLLPVWVVLAFGGCFALGVVLVVAGLFVPASVTGSFGWLMTVLGLLGAGAAGFGRVLLERSNARQLEACQRQILMLQAQIKQAEEERDVLDGQLPQGGGPLPSRLHTAEAQLAALEDLVPLRSKRDAAQQRVEAATRRLAESEGDLTAARRGWNEVLDELGLPPKLSPKKVRHVLIQCEQHTELFRQLRRRSDELAARRRELESIDTRVRELAGEAGISAGSSTPAALLAQLDGALSRQRDRVERYRQLRLEASQLRRQHRKRVEAISHLRHRRRALLLEAGVEEEQQLRELSVQAVRASMLRQEHEGLTREIEAAAMGTCSAQTLAEEIATGNLEERLDQLLLKLDATETRLRELLERRGQANEQIRNLAADRQLARRQLDLATVEAKLQAAVRRWQVFAVASRILDAIRTDYERDRQPETLQEASGYLKRLTRGRYCRVWTPLGEDSLRVDDASGNAFAVESLSRGTREQLFLALRLALAASYARRDAPLPLVFDDVLVNFDADRARAAAELLREFAKAGHQVLVFTCHEHIFELFRSLNLPAAQLPSNTRPNPATLYLTASAKRKRRRADKPKPVVAPEKTVAPTAAEVDDEPDEESPLHEGVAPIDTDPSPSLADMRAGPLDAWSEDDSLWPEEDRSPDSQTAGRVFDADFFSSEDESANAADWALSDGNNGFEWRAADPGEDNGAPGKEEAWAGNHEPNNFEPSDYQEDECEEDDYEEADYEEADYEEADYEEDDYEEDECEEEVWEDDTDDDLDDPAQAA